MAGVATLVVKVVTDTKAAASDISATSSKMDRFKSTMRSAAIPAAAAGAAVIAFGKKAFDAASRLQQANGAVESVFGKSADTIQTWAKGAADSVGLATSEYEELASVIGSQLKNMGLPMDQVTGKTKDLIEMGADLAATYGGTTKEAVEALGSALRGETDPIEKYGISIKQADIAAQQAADGTDKLEGAAGKAAKTQALLELATKQSAAAHGAFAREADTAAGQQQRASAAMENATAAIGTALLPIVAKAAKLLATLAKWVQRNSTLVAVLAGVILTLAVAVQVVNAVLFLMSLNPVTLTILAIVAGVALLVGGFILLYKKSETVRRIMDTMWSGIKAGAKAAWQYIKGVVRDFQTIWRVAVAVVKGYIRAWQAVFKAVTDVIRGIIKTVTALFKGDWRGAFDAVKGIVRVFRDFFRDIFNLLPDPVQKVITKIKDGLGGAITWIKDKMVGLGEKLSGPWDTMKSAVDAVKTAVGWLIGKIEDLIGWLGKIHLPDVGGWVSKIPGLGGLLSAPVPPPGAPAVVGTRGLVGARTSVAGGTTGGPTIVVKGALDPEAVARQIQALLTNHNRRVGLVAT